MFRGVKNEDGASAVEFAIVMMLFVTLLFGIVEFGLIIKDYLTLSQAAREGVRSASLGSPTSVVTSRVQNDAPTLTTTSLTITLYKRTVGTTPGAWTALGNTTDGKSNNAASGDEVRVSVTYPHQLITGNLLTCFGSGNTHLNMTGDMIMRRE